MVAYTATHDVLSAMQPGTAFPLARIPRSSYTGSEDDAWAEGGFLAGYLVPGAGEFEYFPSNTAIESSWYSNYTLPDTNNDSQALAAGDSVQLAMAGVRADTPMPFDRQRTSTGGTLAWDLVSDERTVSATYAGVTESMDVVLFRADLYATGADIDARNAELFAPPLTIPLAHTYSPQVTSAGTVSVGFPATQYYEALRLEIQPATGEAVLQAGVQGYIPQAASIARPGGSTLKEWHIPLYGAIAISPPTPAAGATPFAPRLSVFDPGGGIAMTVDGATQKTYRVAPGDTIVSGPGATPSVVTKARELSAAVPATLDVAAASHGPPVASAAGSAPGQSLLTQELQEVAPINSSLSAPTPLTLGLGRYTTTVDPNYQGQGALALTGLQHEDGTRYVDAASIPYAIVDGAPVALDQHNLVDLRVEPSTVLLDVTFAGLGASTPFPDAIANNVSVVQPGLDVSAVYNAGSDVYVFIDYHLCCQTLSAILGPTQPEPDYLEALGEVLALDGGAHQASLVQYQELHEQGPVTYGGMTHETEFSAPLDAQDSSLGTLSVGSHQVAASIFDQPTDGIATVMRAPAAITPYPSPDGAVSIDGEPLALIYSTPAGAQSPVPSVSVMVTVLQPNAPTPTTAPALGVSACGAPQIAGTPAGLPADQDIESAWFDDDSQYLYVSMSLGNVPTAAPSGTVEDWQVHWAYEHAYSATSATLDSTGTWTFQYGGFSTTSFVPTNTVTGDVRTGANGIIRVWVPRDLLQYRNGELLRNTSAEAGYDVAGVFAPVDAAPAGTSTHFGAGGDYVVGCVALSASTPDSPGAGWMALVGGVVVTAEVLRRRRRRAGSR